MGNPESKHVHGGREDSTPKKSNRESGNSHISRESTPSASSLSAFVNERHQYTATSVDRRQIDGISYDDDDRMYEALVRRSLFTNNTEGTKSEREKYPHDFLRSNTEPIILPNHHDGPSRDEWEREQEEEEEMLALIHLQRVIPPLEGTYLEKNGTGNRSVEMLNTNGVLGMLSEFKCMSEAKIYGLTETQKSLNQSVSNLERRTVNAIEISKSSYTQVQSFALSMRDVDKMVNHLDSMKSELEQISRSIEYLNGILPEDMRESLSDILVDHKCAHCARTFGLEPTENPSEFNLRSSSEQRKAIKKSKSFGFSILGQSSPRPGLFDDSKRSIEWSKRIGNLLGITKGDYERVKKMVEMEKMLIDKHCSSSSLLKMEEMELSLEEKQLGLPFVEYSSLNSLKKLFKLITLDMPRTFLPGINLSDPFPFENYNGNNIPREEFLEQVINLLEMYIVFRPKVGYAQGMTYVAVMLTVHLDPLNAFICFSNMLENHFFSSIYSMQVGEISKHFTLYELLFSQNLPSLYEHFKNLNITPDVYLLSWLTTVFCRILPLDICCKIWDRFLEEGELFLLKSAIGILRIFNSKLVRFSFEEITDFLKNLPNEQFSHEELMQGINSISTPSYASNILNKISFSGK
eukprot:TRINITY_DN3433_c0_g1_i3.p1 TRINITY_DN3433_c0_g1~~TRINITY_DN3433_c0_g1_i3.p1  ORF type:complete len:634 (-),score=171.47 TRINITY_DN3433_c0_g1_i3:647-2548(-)